MKRYGVLLLLGSMAQDGETTTARTPQLQGVGSVELRLSIDPECCWPTEDLPEGVARSIELSRSIKRGLTRMAARQGVAFRDNSLASLEIEVSAESLKEESGYVALFLYVQLLEPVKVTRANGVEAGGMAAATWSRSTTAAAYVSDSEATIRSLCSEVVEEFLAEVAEDNGVLRSECEQDASQ